jgi:DDE domain
MPRRPNACSMALSDPSHPQPRVINTDKARLYGSAIAAVKEEGTLHRRCRHRPAQYLNNILEQDHRAIKRRVAKQSFREFRAAQRTIDGYEAHAHDPEGSGAVGQRRCCSPTDSVHRQAFRSGGLRPRRPVPLVASSVTVFKVATLPVCERPPSPTVPVNHIMQRSIGCGAEPENARSFAFDLGVILGEKPHRRNPCAKSPEIVT